jgi:hypothetical protein
MLCTSVPGTVLCDGSGSQGSEGSGSFHYDASMGEPLLPVFRQLSDEIPVGYGTRELLDSLPDQAVSELAFFTYGDANSRCVAVAVIRSQPNRLYVDLDRNRHFDVGEEMFRPAGDSADRWQLDLHAEFVVSSGQFEHVQRRAEIRVHQTTGKLEFATLGCMRGTTVLESRTVEVLRTDSNGSGLWFDADDRFWIDIDGMGTLVPTRICADPSARVTECEAILVSDTGVHVFLRDTAGAVAVPVGTYRLCSLRLSLQDARGHWTSGMGTDAFVAAVGGHAQNRG